MYKIKRVTANLPIDLLDEAIRTTQKGITETLVEGLRLVKRSAAYEKAQALKGKLDLSVNLDLSRERPGR